MWTHRRLLFHFKHIRQKRRAQKSSRGESFLLSPLLITLLIGLGLPVIFIRSAESRLRPIIAEVAQVQAANKITSLMESAVAEELSARNTAYSDFVSIHRDDSGTITALTTNVTSLNILRGELVDHLLMVLDTIDISTIQIPMGALFGSELVWAKGPNIRVHAMSAGSITAEFESMFSSSGVNQTLHQIQLAIQVPLTIFLPGGSEQFTVETTLCVAETVIVGAVPSTYLELPHDSLRN